VSTLAFINPFRKLIFYIEDISYKKGDTFFQFLSFLIHLLILIPMINFTFKEEITDIPLILPVEMFIVEEETTAPEFQQEVNEIMPTYQEEVIGEKIEIEESSEIIKPIVEETIQMLLSQNLPFKK